MEKVIIVKNGKQLCIPVIDEVVAPEDTLIWDTRISGPIPEGLDGEVASVVNGKLVSDRQKIAVKQKANADAEAEAAAKELAYKQRLSDMAALKEKLKANTLTWDEGKQLLRLERGL